MVNETEEKGGGEEEDVKKKNELEPEDKDETLATEQQQPSPEQPATESAVSTQYSSRN